MSSMMRVQASTASGSNLVVQSVKSCGDAASAGWAISREQHNKQSDAHEALPLKTQFYISRRPAPAGSTAPDLGHTLAHQFDGNEKHRDQRDLVEQLLRHAPHQEEAELIGEQRQRQQHQ